MSIKYLSMLKSEVTMCYKWIFTFQLTLNLFVDKYDEIRHYLPKHISHG